MDLIVEAICPLDGAQDADASRHAISAATIDLLNAFPDVDLTALDASQIDFLIEAYVGHDLCERIDLDVGGSIQKHAPDSATAIRRLEQMKEYVIVRIRAAFATLRSRNERLERGRVESIVGAVLKNTLHIFEEYLL